MSPQRGRKAATRGLSHENRNGGWQWELVESGISIVGYLVFLKPFVKEEARTPRRMSTSRPTPPWVPLGTTGVALKEAARSSTDR